MIKYIKKMNGGNKTMKNYTIPLTTLEKNTIRACVKKADPQCKELSEIFSAGKATFQYIVRNYPKIFKRDRWNNYIAFVFSEIARYSLTESKTLNVENYLKFYAKIKLRNRQVLNDLGATGDLVEVLTRCAIIKNYNLAKHSLYVKQSGKVDIISKKLGRVEVGHNGKTFTQGSALDPVDGPFDSVIYGMYSPEDERQLYNFMLGGQYFKAVEMVKQYMVYWDNKYDFLTFIEGMTEGHGILFKDCGPQVVYNTGKYKKFIACIESGELTTLADIL